MTSGSISSLSSPARMFLRMLPLLIAMALCGCGGDSGPKRYQVSGTVTYDGKPVVKGTIYFSPDTESGNDGPGGIAVITQGQYRTEPSRGIVGGSHHVRIVGYDGVPATVEGEELPDGKPLFTPFETIIDFPREDTTEDFNIPKPE